MDPEIIQKYQVAVEKLKAALIEATDALKREKREKRDLESKLRNEICDEMKSQLTEIENYYE